MGDTASAGGGEKATVEAIVKAAKAPAAAFDQSFDVLLVTVPAFFSGEGLSVSVEWLNQGQKKQVSKTPLDLTGSHNRISIGIFTMRCQKRPFQSARGN